MEEFILARGFEEVLSDAQALEPSLESVRAKLRPVFEAYALSIGTVQSKLRVIDVCDERGEVSNLLRRFVYNDYPGTEAYRGQIISRIRKIIRALTGANEEDIKRGEFSVLTRAVPAYMRPMLVHLPRELPEWQSGSNLDVETRLRYPISEAGLRYLSACLDVHRKYQPLTLDALLCEHSAQICNSLKKLFGKKRGKAIIPQGSRLRKKLGMRLPKKRRVSLTRELWPPTLCSEWEMYAEKAITDGSGDRELAEVEAFGFNIKEVTRSTVECRESIMGIALGHIVPYARSLGIEDFGVEELLKIEHGVRRYKGLEIPYDFNPLVEFYRQREKSRSSDRKRSNRDSVSFDMFADTVKRLGIYAGKAHLVEPFGSAYRKQMLDTETTEARKALRLATYPCALVDDRIEKLDREFNRIVKTGAFKKETRERPPRESDANFGCCVYYVALLVMRFLGYRQQCLRYCKVGENITFNRDGSITLFWPKGKIKNKKPIKVVLDAKKRPYQKRLVSALRLYYREVYSYAHQWSASRGNLGLIDNQFFIHMNRYFEYACFTGGSRRGGMKFYSWWIRSSETYMKFDELGIEDRLPFNPHFLRTLCINWMKDDLGLSDEEIAEAVGDTVAVVRSKYISKERIYDATPITDKIADRIREREEKEVGLKEQLKQAEKRYEAKATLLQHERDSFKKAVERAEQRVTVLEAEVAAERAARESDKVTIREQAGLISELATKISELTASGGTAKEKRARVAR